MSVLFAIALAMHTDYQQSYCNDIIAAWFSNT